MTPSAAPESTARPRAAARPARVFAQGRFETLTLLRNGEQLLVSVVLPAMALVGLTLSPYPALGDVHRIDVTAPGVLALAVASTAFTGQAISTAFDRRYGVLRMYGVSPLGRSGLLMGKLIAVGAVLLVQVLLLGGLALALGCEHGGEEGFCESSPSVWVCSSPAPCGPKPSWPWPTLRGSSSSGSVCCSRSPPCPRGPNPSRVHSPRVPSVRPCAAPWRMAPGHGVPWGFCSPGRRRAGPWPVACSGGPPSQNPSRRRTKHTPRSSNVGSAAAYPPLVPRPGRFMWEITMSPGRTRASSPATCVAV